MKLTCYLSLELITNISSRSETLRLIETKPTGTSCFSPIPQENRPKGTSVLQLTVSDRDASHNGPPFAFTIVDGNEGDAFHIDQQGALVAAGPLNRKSREHYLLQAQVSGRY